MLHHQSACGGYALAVSVLHDFKMCDAIKKSGQSMLK